MPGTVLAAGDTTGAPGMVPARKELKVWWGTQTSKEAITIRCGEGGMQRVWAHGMGIFTPGAVESGKEPREKWDEAFPREGRGGGESFPGRGNSLCKGLVRKELKVLWIAVL